MVRLITIITLKMGLMITYYFIESFKRDHTQDGRNSIGERHFSCDLFRLSFGGRFPFCDLQNGFLILSEGGGNL